MKKLNKIPSKGKVYYDSPSGFNHNYGFIFSEELPYLHREKKVEYFREVSRRRKTK